MPGIDPARLTTLTGRTGGLAARRAVTQALNARPASALAAWLSVLERRRPYAPRYVRSRRSRRRTARLGCTGDRYGRRPHGWREPAETRRLWRRQGPLLAFDLFVIAFRQPGTEVVHRITARIEVANVGRMAASVRAVELRGPWSPSFVLTDVTASGFPELQPTEFLVSKYASTSSRLTRRFEMP